MKPAEKIKSFWASRKPRERVMLVCCMVIVAALWFTLLSNKNSDCQTKLLELTRRAATAKAAIAGLPGVEAAEAKQRESLATYEKTVQGAFKEMRDALTRQQEMSNVVASLERMVKELRLSVELANTRYDNGYSSYLEVLDAERSLFDSEMQLAAARSERLSSIVNVCLALGGGWK